MNSLYFLKVCESPWVENKTAHERRRCSRLVQTRLKVASPSSLRECGYLRASPSAGGAVPSAPGVGLEYELLQSRTGFMSYIAC